MEGFTRRDFLLGGAAGVLALSLARLSGAPGRGTQYAQGRLCLAGQVCID